MRDILRRLVAGDLTEEQAVAELRRLQLDELDGRAKLDLGRFMRRGIPEVVLAIGKTPADAARLAVAMAERQGQGLISRMSDAHRVALQDAADAAGMDGVLPGLVAGLIDVPVIGLPVSTGYGRGGAGEAALTTMLQSCSTGLVVVNIDNGVGAGAAAVLIAQRRLRGRKEATTAPTSAPARSTPNKTGATARHMSTPPGTAKVRASTKTTKKTAASSHGKPRRRRP
jgi:NCAIR mutase (PurE)-related protein